MQSDQTSYLDKRRQYLANRTIFRLKELAKYAGEWISWSPDGAQIVAHSTDRRALDGLIRAAGEDPEQCLVEGIPADDSVIGVAGPDLDRA